MNEQPPEPTLARLAYLTWPAIDQAIINIVLDGDRYPRQFAITRDQLFIINAQSADLVLRVKDK